MQEAVKRYLLVVIDFPKRYLPPAIYDLALLGLLSTAVMACAYYWLTYTLIGLGAALVGTLIGEGYCYSKFKQHLYEKIPAYFYEKDSFAFYEKAEQNTLAVWEVAYYLASRWFRKPCAYQLLYCNDLKTSNVIHFAAINGRADLLSAYMSHKLDFADLNLFGRPALYLAVKKGHNNLITVFKGQPNLINQKVGKKQQTAMHVAAKKGDFQAYLALWEIGGDPKMKDHAGQTPLELMIQNPSKSWLMYLSKRLKNKLGDVNYRGHYLLHYAVTLEKLDCLRFLVENLDDKALQQKNPNGFNARDLAHLQHLEEAEALLKQKGCELSLPEQNFKRLQYQNQPKPFSPEIKKLFQESDELFQSIMADMKEMQEENKQSKQKATP